MKKFLAFVAAVFFATAAYGQNAGTVTNHAFAIGKGPNVSGYTSLLCGAGQLAVAQVGADPICRTISGDWTLNAAGVSTLATVNANLGAFGSAANCASITVNAKGLVTAASQTACVPGAVPLASITGLGTGVATALGVNVGTAGAPVVNGGALGTPSSGVATSLTGTAAGLTAGNVTTNANLTGDVTSVGNATTLAAGNAGNLNAGTLLAARMPALTGDCTTSAGAVATACTKTGGVAFAASATTDTTSATNIGTGTLANGRYAAVNLAGGNVNGGVTGVTPFANGGTNDSGTAPATFTPTPTCGTATWTVTSAKWKLLAAKVTFLELDLTVSTIGNCAASNFTLTLPNTPNSSGAIPGAEITVVGGAFYCRIISASTTATCIQNAAALAAGDHFILSGTYESQ